MTDIRPEPGGRDGAYWYAAWIDEAGRRKRKSLGSDVKTRRAAVKACNQMMRDAEAGRPIQPGKAPVLSAWKTLYFQAKPYTRGTRQGYETTVTLLVEAIGDLPLNKFTRRHAAEFRVVLTDRGIAEATICKHVRNCKAMFNEAKGQDLIGFNPFDRQTGTPPEVDADWKYVTLAEFDAMLGYAPNPKWRAMLALTRLAGMRRAEALRLTWEDVDFEARTLTVRNPRRTRTTKHRTRITAISPRLYALLLERHEAAEPGETLVVGYSAGHFAGSNPRGGYAQLKQIQKLAGVKPWDDPFHDMRRSLISDWYADGHAEADIVKMLGNSKDVSRRYYHRVLDRTMARITGEDQDAKDLEIARLRQRVADLESQSALP